MRACLSGWRVWSPRPAVGRPEHRHYGSAHGCGYVHGAAVVAQEKVTLLYQRGRFLNVGPAREVQQALVVSDQLLQPCCNLAFVGAAQHYYRGIVRLYEALCYGSEPLCWPDARPAVPTSAKVQGYERPGTIHARIIQYLCYFCATLTVYRHLGPPAGIGVGAKQPYDPQPVIGLVHRAEAPVGPAKVEEGATPVVQAGTGRGPTPVGQGRELESAPLRCEMVEQHKRIVSSQAQPGQEAGGLGQSFQVNKAAQVIEREFVEGEDAVYVTGPLQETGGRRRHQQIYPSRWVSGPQGLQRGRDSQEIAQVGQLDRQYTLVGCHEHIIHGVGTLERWNVRTLERSQVRKLQAFNVERILL